LYVREVLRIKSAFGFKDVCVTGMEITVAVITYKVLKEEVLKVC
jgi:hypothetical protein